MPRRLLTPRQNIEAESSRRGRPALVAGCVTLLGGGDVDDELIRSLGGRPADYVLAGGEGGRTGYWPRVWAARGLLHIWSSEATSALISATADESWRVREMAAKVVARHAVDEALEAVIRLRSDPVVRVRQAAERALRALTVQGDPQTPADDEEGFDGI